MYVYIYIYITYTVNQVTAGMVSRKLFGLNQSLFLINTKSYTWQNKFHFINNPCDFVALGKDSHDELGNK